MNRSCPARGLVIFALVMVACVGLVHAAPRYDRVYQVVKVDVHDSIRWADLLALDASNAEIEIWSHAPVRGVVDVKVSTDARSQLDAAGFTYEVEIADLQARVDEVFAPVGEGTFFDGYRTNAEHLAFLQQLAAGYPGLAQVQSIGRTLEGRDMWVIRITGPGSDKPGVMYHGGQHGDEVMGPCVVAYTARYLLENYGDDPQVTQLVDQVEWFLLPIMNPDGYESGSRSNAAGYDLNRNWDGPGANSSPFSQPETAAMRDFFLGHPNVRAYIDFHSSGWMIMWPWEYTSEWCVDHFSYEALAIKMRDAIFASRGSDYSRIGPVYSTIYPVNGGSLDYAYGVLGIWAITFELGYGHYMSVSEILPTCEEITPTMLMFSEWVSDCNENGILDFDDIDFGESEDCNANRTPDSCEILSDFDGDLIVDVCDPDLDNDGVPNETDVCDDTPRGFLVTEKGWTVGDNNGDCVVDLNDYARLQSCLRTGPARLASDYCETNFDVHEDGFVDLSDYANFMNVFTASGSPQP